MSAPPAGASDPTPCYLPCDFVEADGVDTDFFTELWSDHPGVVPLSARGVLLKCPHTVVFSHNVPFGWYFTSVKEGRYMKRNKKRLNKDEIYRLMSPCGTSGICARWVSRGLELHAVGGNLPKTTTRYLTPESLRTFLAKRDGGASGLLQKFVEPPGKHVRVLRAHWTPHVCYIQQYTNLDDLYSRKVPLGERAAGFEAKADRMEVRMMPTSSHIGMSVGALCR